MKLTIAAASILAAMTTAAMADAPAGAAAMPCDASAFVPVMSADGTRVLYWNNPTCEIPAGASDGLVNDPCAPWSSGNHS